jgi:hypothetical protein
MSTSKNRFKKGLRGAKRGKSTRKKRLKEEYSQSERRNS